VTTSPEVDPAGDAAEDVPHGRPAGHRAPDLEPYRRALLDWCACAVGGNLRSTLHDDPLSSGLIEDVAHLGFAGHVLDFDDTFTPGLAHLSAATAPAAVVLAAQLGRTVDELLEAYAAGFEAMAAFTEASHPELYDRGWHPTAVCGSVGAAVTAVTLLGLPADGRRHAVRLALLSSAGLRAAFGSDGKAYQVGRAAADGLLAALAARRGATVPARIVTGEGSFAAVYGGVLADVAGERAIEQNWLKAYPCCLQTHAPIEAGLELARRFGPALDRAVVTVHPVSLQAAAGSAEVTTGLEAKFSIPYLTAWAVFRGEPMVDHFDHVDRDVVTWARRIAVRVDEGLGPNACRLAAEVDGQEHHISIEAPRGAPARPLDDQGLAEKVRSLGAATLAELLADGRTPASRLARYLGVAGRRSPRGGPLTDEGQSRFASDRGRPRTPRQEGHG
jgi:2-methylcitrate dehydratase PrpD